MKIVRDYFDDHYSYLSEARAKRPQELVAPKNQAPHNPRTCYFCPGNEAQTPPEIGRISDGENGWSMRWFPNKFPALSLEDGSHEIIVETSDSQKQLWDFSESELVQLLSVYQERIKTHLADEKIRAVCVFKNHGFDAGASIEHSHTQVIATSVTPSRLERMRRPDCVYCKILHDLSETLLIGKNDEFMTFSPQAPRVSMESWIMAKNHGEFALFSPDTLMMLAKSLETIVKKLRELNAPYCFYINAVAGANDTHFCLEILPRLDKWAGFELATGDYIISVSPEQGAEFFR